MIDIDKIAMIALLILYIVTGIGIIFIYLIIRETNENKTEWERQIEDEEQMDYLKNYNNRRKKIGGKNK